MKTTQQYELACRHEEQARHEIKAHLSLGLFIGIFCGLLFYGTLFLAMRAYGHSHRNHALVEVLTANEAANSRGVAP